MKFLFRVTSKAALKKNCKTETLKLESIIILISASTFPSVSSLTNLSFFVKTYAFVFTLSEGLIVQTTIEKQWRHVNVISLNMRTSFTPKFSGLTQ